MAPTSSYIRALRGPVLLMALGGLLVVDQSGSYPFWRTWPVLLVVMGLMILAEKSIASGTEGGAQS